MPTSDTRRLGYGASAVVDGVQILITTGSNEEADTPSYLEMASIPPNSDSRSRVLHADGIAAFTGTLAFDVGKDAMALFVSSKLFKRRYQFNIGIHDGESQYVMTGCYLTTLSLSGAPAGFITATMSVMATNGRTPGSVTNAYVLNYNITPNQRPLGYWWSGNTDVRDWTLTMNQAVEPMYGNEDTTIPRYLKVGLVEYTLDVVCYQEQSHNVINICTEAFTLTGVRISKGYNFNGVTDLGMYSHSFTTAPSLASAGSDGTVIIITP